MNRATALLISLPLCLALLAVAFRLKKLESRDIAGVSVLAALAIATNYALSFLPNVKLMDSLVFISGALYGSAIGALVGVVVWAVYGVLNPYGFVPQIWIATMLSEAIYGVAGGLLFRKKAANQSRSLLPRLKLALAAVATTLAYDILTNAAFAYTFHIPLEVALAAAVPFTAVHLAANVAIFVVLVPVVLSRVPRKQ